MNKSLFKVFSLITILALMLTAVPMQGALAATPTEIFFSEYIEGSSFNKAVEIYNGTGAAVNLSTYALELYSNGAASPSQSVALSGTLADGDVFVIAHASAAPAILAVADATSSSVINFNGDDAFVLRKGATIIDVIGQIGFDPGTQWSAGGISTLDRTLRRKATIEAGDTNGADAFDPSVEWDGFAINVFDGLGCHLDCPPAVASTVPANSAINVFTSTNININFNEAVSVTGSWFSISCGSSGLHTVTVSGGSQNYILNPDTDFAFSESCTLTVFASNVADQDGTPNNMAANHIFSFTTEAPPLPVCAHS